MKNAIALAAALVAGLASAVVAAEATSTNDAPVAAEKKVSTIALPAPQTDGGLPLMQAMKDRRSLREYSGAELTPQQLSDVLWAAGGINRPDGRRTAGSTRNLQAVGVYAMLRTGIYFYNAAGNVLEPVAEGDFSSIAGPQPFAKTAPLTILFVGDFNTMKIPDRDKQMLFFGCDVGLMSQNVYLYCASAGLATVVRGMVESGPLTKAMGLPESKSVLLAQSVGVPKPKPLVAFYSWGGNTRAAAEAVAKAIGADIVEIKPADPYPEDYQVCVARAASEIKEGVKPTLIDGKLDLSKYETVIVGSPNWWGTIAPPVASFLSTNDFSGKKLSLFVTHGTGGMQNCATDAAKAARTDLTSTTNWVGGEVKGKLGEIAAWAKKTADDTAAR